MFSHKQYVLIIHNDMEVIVHDRKGAVALGSPEIYVKNEIRAKEKLAREYPEFFQG